MLQSKKWGERSLEKACEVFEKNEGGYGQDDAGKKAKSQKA